jgi:galactose oxidase-like protein/Big-like domain-containing protein
MVMMIRFRQLRLWLLAGLLAVSSLRCGGDVGPTTAKAIDPVAGDQQTGRAGQELTNPLVVSVTDGSGNGVPGIEVHWAAQGGGSVTTETSKTGSDGRASVRRVLGPDIGQQATTASVSGLEGSPVTFTATAAPGGQPGVSVVTQPPASALEGEVFEPANQPVVSVSDASGSPVAEAEVTASLVSGGGTLEGKTTATTNASGIATFADLGIRGTGAHTIQFTAASASATSNSITLDPLPTEATKGAWGPVVNWDIVPLHMSLMPNGKIITWGKTDVPPDTMGMPRIWDPAAGPPSTARMIDVDTMLFCAGFALMPDGRLLVSGGHLKDDRGIATTRFFTQDGAWSAGPNMAHGRWYPTVTVLPDGRVLTMAGRDQSKTVVTTPEIWENNHWVELPGAGPLEIPYYPRNFVDPKDGRIFYASERVQSRWFNVDGTGVGGGRGSWSAGPTHIFGFNRDYGSAVMYDVGKILVVGGGGNDSWPTPDPKTTLPTATAEVIDLKAANSTWQSTGSMANRRRHMNATVLPDGQVLATGGTRGGGFVDINEGDAVKAAELWNPKTGNWTTLASNTKMRVYHSVSMLLPNGTVLHGSSGDAMADGLPVPPERNHEIFSPPYLFKGARPSIASAPASISYGQVFSVATPNAAQITEVRVIRLGAVTHAFDQGQLANKLSFQATPSGVDVTAPADRNQAPPGYYLVFIVNRIGVPSEGHIIKLQ